YSAFTQYHFQYQAYHFRHFNSLENNSAIFYFGKNKFNLIFFHYLRQTLWFIDIYKGRFYRRHSFKTFAESFIEGDFKGCRSLAMKRSFQSTYNRIILEVFVLRKVVLINIVSEF